MATKRKRSTSVQMEQEQKRSRDMTVLEKNDALTKYIDTLIPGATAPEQQLSFDVAAKLAKPGILDIDDDLDDNLTAEERFCIERDSIAIGSKAEEYNTGLSSFMTNLRAKNLIKMRTPIPEEDEDSMQVDDEEAEPEKEEPTEKKEIKPMQKWDPLARNAQEKLESLLSEDDQRLLESSGTFVILQSMRSYLEHQTFAVTQHFRNVLDRYLTLEHKGVYQVVKDDRCIIAVTARDDEFASSPLPQLKVVFLLVSEKSVWRWKQSWLLPVNIEIVCH